MPEPSTAPPATKPVRRLGISFHVTVQLVLILVVVIAANYLSCAHHKRYDLTGKKDFTLSDFTEKFLHSDTVQKRTQPLRAIAVVKRESPHYTRIYNLLDEYQRLAKGMLEVEFVDPLRQTDRTLEIENTYSQPYTEDMVIIDARQQKTSDQPAPTSPAPAGKSTSESTTPAATQKQDLSAHVRRVTISDLCLRDDRRNIVAWQDEDVITSSLIGAIEGKARRFYFAADKVNLEAQGDGIPEWQTLFEMLWQQNILLTPLRLSETESIPEDAEGFALIAPQYDLNDREIKVLTNYWDRKQSALFVTLDPKAKLGNLRVFLRTYGITPRNDRVMSSKGGQSLSSVQAIFSRGAEINSSLGGKSTIFDGSTSSLEVRENDDQLLNKRVHPIALIEASEGWWGETRFEKENPVFDREEDTAGPIYLAAAVLRGQATSDDTANLVSRMVVIANTDFLKTKKTRPEQADFVKSSFNWLIGREDLIGIGPKKLHRHKITILDAHNTFISRAVLIFLPAAAILLALLVWNVRRA